MIIFMLCVFIGGFVAFRCISKSKKKGEILKTDLVSVNIVTCVLGLVVGAVVGLGISKIASLIISHTIVQRYEYEKIQLVALGNSNELRGSFFLASGDIGTEQYYKFFYRTADGGKQFGKVHAENATVYEEERGDAYMSRTGKKDIYSERVHFWLIPKFLMDEPQGRYAIHVPKGTVKAEYKLDLM